MGGATKHTTLTPRLGGKMKSVHKRTRLKRSLVDRMRSAESDPGLQKDWRRAMITRTHIVSEKRALEIAAWARIVDRALKREANRAFLAGEIARATSFLPLIAHTEQLAGK
jgi:hypothetical protein